nr:ferrous iron transport protein A [Oceanipulchritudo coccoides]
MDAVVKLKDMEPGQRGIVKEFTGGEGDRLRLMEMGLLPGTEIRFVRRAPLGDPLEVEVRGFHLSLRSSEAARIGISVV